MNSISIHILKAMEDIMQKKKAHTKMQLEVLLDFI